MQKYSKLSLIIFLIASGCMLVYILLSFYIFDPLQVWHKSFFNKNTYSYNIRESAKAFIRDNEFDSVILGNSYSENTSAKKASDILGGNFINLSMSGSTLSEKNILLKYLLNKKDIKQVVFVLDFHYYKLKRGYTGDFDYLYDDDPLNDIKIYLNNRYFLCATGLAKNSVCKIRNNLNIDCPYRWEDEEFHYKRFGGFENWLKNKNNRQIKTDFDNLLDTPKEINQKTLEEKYILDLKKYMNQYLLDIINDYPNIKFHIIISPVSDLRLAQSIRDEDLSFKKTALLIDILTDFQAKHSNIEIYAFDNLPDMGKIENYKDLTHYKSQINYLILNSIARKENQITIKNKEQYIRQVFNKAKSVDWQYYIDEIKK